MKKRIVPVVTLTVALLLFTGIAYAVEKKRQGKSPEQTPETGHEEESLKAELLAAAEPPPGRAPATVEAGTRKVDADRTDAKQGQSKSNR